MLPASAREGGERPSKTAGKSYAYYEMKTTIDFLVEGQSIKFVINLLWQWRMGSPGDW